jgi:Uma2 family endonuclease
MTLPRPIWTLAEYLQFERRSVEKHEFIDGEVVVIAAGSRNHNLLTARVTALLDNQLRATLCAVYSADMKVRAGNGCFYPDAVIVRDEPQFADELSDVLLNPTVIVEVLSPSTAQYDRVTKFHAYQQLDSLQEYILVEAMARRVEQRCRQRDGTWDARVTMDADGLIDLSSIGCRLNVAAVYEKVTLEPPASG